jgi:hypothetical protein
MRIKGEENISNVMNLYKEFVFQISEDITIILQSLSLSLSLSLSHLPSYIL